MSTDATGQHVGAAEEVRRRVLDEIRQGTLRPGDRLGAERDLATRYG